MKVKYIIKTMLIMMNRSAAAFIITILMLAASFTFMLFEAANYMSDIYMMIHNQMLLSVDAEHVYTINTEYYRIFWDGEEMKNFYDFVMGLNNEEEHTVSGMYYRTTIDEKDALCISKELLSIGKLQDVDGKRIEWENDNSVAVGYELRNQYPVGSIIRDEYYGTEYQVTQILKRNSEWLGEAAVTGLETSINLDNLILLDDSMHMQQSYYTDILNAGNNKFFYHPTMNDEEANQYIKEHAERMGIRTYTADSLKTESRERLIYAYKADTIELIFAAVSLVLSMLGQYLAVIINLEYRKHGYGVLLACNWRRRDVVKMSMLECSLRIIVSLCIAVPIAYKLLKDTMSGVAVGAFYWILPVWVIGLAVFNLVCNQVVSKWVNQYSVRKMLEGRTWK